MGKKEKLWEIDRDGNITAQHLKFVEFLSAEGGTSLMEDGQRLFHLKVDRVAKEIVLADINHCEVVLKFKKIIEAENAANLRFREMLHANLRSHTEQCARSELYAAAATRLAHKTQWALNIEAENLNRFANYAARQGIEISILPDGRVIDAQTWRVLGTVAAEIPKVVVGARITEAEALSAGITAGNRAQPLHTEEEILIGFAKAFEQEERRLKAAGLPVPKEMTFEYDPSRIQ